MTDKLIAESRDIKLYENETGAPLVLTDRNETVLFGLETQEIEDFLVVLTTALKMKQNGEITNND
jgi:hypothetical protein